MKRDEEAFAAILEKEANADIFAEQQHLETELMKAISHNETVAQPKKCSLNNDDNARAKRLGLNPKSLIKNNTTPSKPWKAPVREWLIEIEEKRDANSKKLINRSALDLILL